MKLPTEFVKFIHSHGASMVSRVGGASFRDL